MAGYQIRELGNGITAIEEGAVRMFLIRGRQRALLVDTGFGGGDLRALVGQLYRNAIPCDGLARLPGVLLLQSQLCHPRIGQQSKLILRRQGMRQAKEW